MKNKKMGILAVLVMLVAVTLNSVGGTYAKYISQYGMTDEARVAKWSFEDKETTTVDLFQASYTNDNGVYVASKDAAKVVAPGTSGVYKYQIEGTAETNYELTKSQLITNKIFLVDYNGNVTYNPIEFSTDGINWTRATTEVKENGKVVALTISEAETKTVFAANHVLGPNDVKGEIHWRWVFDADAATAAGITDYTGNDTLDTVLGNNVAADPTSLTISATVGVTVVQTEAAPTVASTQAYTTATNRLPAEDAKYFADNGYDAEKAKDVKFTGNAISGDIYKTVGVNADLAEAYFGTSNKSDYYYTVNIRNTTGSAFVVVHSKENKHTVVPAGENLSLMIALHPDAANKEYAYTVYPSESDATAGTNGTTYSIDYSALNWK